LFLVSIMRIAQTQEKEAQEEQKAVKVQEKKGTP
jgi:hypothetical protein